MPEFDDKAYLTPPDNEARAIFKCALCRDLIYEGDKYFDVDGEAICEDCTNVHFRKIAYLNDDF